MDAAGLARVGVMGGLSGALRNARTLQKSHHPLLGALVTTGSLCLRLGASHLEGQERTLGGFSGSRVDVQAWGECEKPGKSKGCISSWGAEETWWHGTTQPPVSSQASLPPHCSLPMVSTSILAQPFLAPQHWLHPVYSPRTKGAGAEGLPGPSPTGKGSGSY